MAAFYAFLKDDSGQGLVEYALIVALIAVVCVAALSFTGARTNNTLNSASAPLG